VQRKPCLGPLAQEGLQDEFEARLAVMQSWTEGPVLAVFTVSPCCPIVLDVLQSRVSGTLRLQGNGGGNKIVKSGLER